MYNKKSDFIFNLIILLCLIIIALIVFEIWYVLSMNKLEYKTYNRALITNVYNYDEDKHLNYKKVLDDYYNTPHLTFYTDKFLKNNENGKSSVIARIIWIRPNLKGLNDIKTYAHEIIHVKYQVANERFVQFKTITTLYESEDNFLKYVAINYANDILKGNYTKEYDCGYYLLEYFKNKEIINYV